MASTGTDDITALFRRCYGLNAPESGGALDVQTWQNAIADFQQTFTGSVATDNSYHKNTNCEKNNQHKTRLLR